MKLLKKTSLYYISFTVPILAIAGWVCYIIITSEVKVSNDELLQRREAQIEDYIHSGDTLMLNYIKASGEAQVYFMKKSIGEFHTFSDTLMFDANENEPAPIRLLTSAVATSNGSYIVKVWRSTLEYQELVAGIATSLFLILFLLFLSFYFVNWFISKELWKPFYRTLEMLRSFRASNQALPEIEASSVTEFSDLNTSLSFMMKQMVTDFRSQKQFTENASHEMQTPLAILKSKVDLLIQSDILEDKELALIHSIDDAVSKLSRLNKSLLLLAKIENRQFQLVEDVSIATIIDESLKLFEEQIDQSKIVITKNFNIVFSIRMNRDLCQILINNIIHNAIRHNFQNGSIEINLDDEQLTVKNTGLPLPFSSKDIFNRFQRNTASRESLGLGLAIAKEITESSGFKLYYNFEMGKHIFTVQFHLKS